MRHRWLILRDEPRVQCVAYEESGDGSNNLIAATTQPHTTRAITSAHVRSLEGAALHL